MTDQELVNVIDMVETGKCVLWKTPRGCYFIHVTTLPEMLGVFGISEHDEQRIVRRARALRRGRQAATPMVSSIGDGGLQLHRFVNEMLVQWLRAGSIVPAGSISELRRELEAP